MDKKMAEQVADATKKMLHSFAGMQKINDHTMEELAKQQVIIAESFVNISAKQIKGMGNIKTLQDMVNVQADMVADVSNMMVENVQRTMDLLSRSREELKRLIDQELNNL